MIDIIQALIPCKETEEFSFNETRKQNEILHQEDEEESSEIETKKTVLLFLKSLGFTMM